jgi:hypothetical protein
MSDIADEIEKLKKLTGEIESMFQTFVNSGEKFFNNMKKTHQTPEEGVKETGEKVVDKKIILG